MQNDLATPVKIGVEAISEIVLPGGSNLVKGDLKTGGTHTALGFAAGLLMGLPGILLVSANSLSKATSGKNLWEHMQSEKQSD